MLREEDLARVRVGREGGRAEEAPAAVVVVGGVAGEGGLCPKEEGGR